MVNDYGGGSLNGKEKASMIELSCDAMLKDDIRFGGYYAVNTTNYAMKIVKCPNDCHKPNENGNVYGWGIHP